MRRPLAQLLPAVVLGALGLFLAIQLIRPARTNPREEPAWVLEPPAGVRALFVRSCDDCHSNRTVWPWYAGVAPVSWLLVHDVNEGREALNFSTWGNLPSARKARLLREICDEVKAGEMPPWTYRLAHPASLSTEERAAICDWAAASAR